MALRSQQISDEVLRAQCVLLFVGQLYIIIVIQMLFGIECATIKNAINKYLSIMLA
jgi:hypothetical protein